MKKEKSFNVCLCAHITLVLQELLLIILNIIDKKKTKTHKCKVTRAFTSSVLFDVDL